VTVEHTTPGESDELVFVALAAYREPELALTIRSCLEQATFPERLRFGVCLQYDDDIPGAGFDCLDELAELTTIRSIRRPWTASRGGCFARWAAQGLYDGERYTLQCDAHSRLTPGWDTILVATMDELPSAKPLITGFPPLYNREGDVDVILEPVELPVPITIAESWSAGGWIHHPSVHAPRWMPLGARPTRFLSGGFVFTLGSWNVEVRQDPEHLYTGEEFALTLRSFTSGYDLWNPPSRVIFHRNHPHGNPKYITDDRDGRSQRRHERATKRLRTLLRGDPDRVLEPYSLGTERSLEDFAAFSGLDCARYEIHPDARAGTPPRLPYEPSAAARSKIIASVQSQSTGR
jgi:hypothetical protein